MFTNNQIDINSIPKLEDISLNPISKKYLNILYLNILLLYSSFIGIIVIINVLVKKDWAKDYFWHALFFLLISFLFQCVITYLGFNKRAYALRTQDVIHTKGLLVHQRTTVPFIRIQHLETKQSFVAKKLKLASLYVYTAGEAGGDLSIKGLPIDEANRINEFLNNKINERL
ncbi:PH domain-containing protein [uncultured Lacinutrix sp.]|uniref:PH domain-containing protein n=1 Tax=uncultured Lacinutrix sp. TaxID=574032 RepID=UPI002631E1E2|nr:PH domain-containing protein [uncultured Lacinutrix sp.]